MAIVRTATKAGHQKLKLRRDATILDEKQKLTSTSSLRRQKRLFKLVLMHILLLHTLYYEAVMVVAHFAVIVTDVNSKHVSADSTKVLDVNVARSVENVEWLG